jgi:hypothetical protein|tara:strand:- start:5237 stop:5647 length:411 start_codon:yes stop_codon:yes gene_type:complete
MLKKIIRNKIVDFTIWCLRKTGLPDKMLGFVLKTQHFSTPLYFAILYLLLPIKLAILALGPLFSSMILFLYLDGCFLSIVEYKLTGNNINIIDPYILFFGDEISPSTRYGYTIGVSAMYFTSVFLMLYLRTYFNKL